MTTNKGGVEYLSAIMIVCLGGILLLFCISSKEIKLCQLKVRDSVDSACLAAAVIDIDEYCKDNILIISDYESAWNNFITSLKTNLDLNDKMQCCNSCVVNKVEVCTFYIFNVIGSKLRISKFNKNGDYFSYDKTFQGDETTPDGTAIESPTIYADISIEISSIFNISKTVHVTSSVDIVKN